MILALLIATAPYQCKLPDIECWQAAALKQEERAERAEAKLELAQQARKVVEAMAADSEARAERWRKTAEQVAPKPLAFYETPWFWMVVGGVAASAVTVGVVYAVVPARSK